jgi:hypothetical protein
MLLRRARAAAERVANGSPGAEGGLGEAFEEETTSPPS